jgi:non-specific protein-tyrosine kinase
MIKNLITLDEPGSTVAEAYRSLYINLSFSGQGKLLRSLLVTSPVSDEGKSTTLANLAVVAAQMGQQVIVVDCDLRQPRLHELFGLKNDEGLTGITSGRSSVTDVLQSIPDVPGLQLLSSGALAASPAQVLASRPMEQLLADLVEQADMVLLDAPPVIAVSDGAILAPRVDGVLLVLQAGQTKRDYARRAKELLEKVNAHIVGAVLNNVAADVALQGY